MEEEEEALLGHTTATPKQRKQQFPLPRFRTSITFVLTALFTGFLFYFIVFSVILSKPGLRASSKDYLFGDDDLQDALYQTVTVTATYSPPLPTDLEEKPPGLSVEGLVELSPDELREMVAGTNGYLVRDWSLGLGWNNMRYIIEAAILQADLLNRTLVLPSFVYARACEYHNDVCAKYATMVNRNDAIGSDEWRNLPIEKQMAWKIPIEVMIDLPHLRQNHNVMTISEFFVLQGLDPSREISNGRWDRDYYHIGVDHPSLFVLQNHAYDGGIARVDYWDPAAYHKKNYTWVTHEKAQKFDEQLILKSTEKEKSVIEWKDAKAALERVMSPINDTQIEQALEASGWVLLETFDGDLGMDYTKTVTKPIKEVTRYDRIHGFVQDYAHVSQDVLLIEGEIHLGRKPGFMFYTTEASRDTFARIVLQDLRVSERVSTLASKVVARMDALNDRRTWMSAHMRRGDFTITGWAMEAKLEDHYRRILDRLAKGRQVLERIQYLLPEPYNVPDVVPNVELASKKPPLEGDYLYLATDERSQDGLQYLREHKAILFDDLVTKEDRREFGWPLLYTDVAALVEQQIIGHGAGYFYAHAMSSVAGGILNTRAATGCDRRTALLD